MGVDSVELKLHKPVDTVKSRDGLLNQILMLENKKKQQLNR